MAAGLKFTDQDNIWFQNRRMRYKKEWKYRNLAGSRSPSVLSWGLSEFSRLFKTFLLFFKPTHNGLSSSTLLPPRLWHWQGSACSLLTFVPLELHTYIYCKRSIDLHPRRGKSSPRWHFKLAWGLSNGRPFCAHQNLNDTSTFTHLWKTGGCLISAPVSKIPKHFHEAF